MAEEESTQQTFGASPTCTGAANMNAELKNSEVKVFIVD